MLEIFHYQWGGEDSHAYNENEEKVEQEYDRTQYWELNFEFKLGEGVDHGLDVCDQGDRHDKDAEGEGTGVVDGD